MSDHLFSKFDLGQVLRNHYGMAQKEIDSYGEDYLLNASETDLVGYVVSKVALDVPQLGEAYMLEPTEVEVDVGHDPMWGRGHGQSTKVKGCRVEVRIPFTGDSVVRLQTDDELIKKTFWNNYRRQTREELPSLASGKEVERMTPAGTA
jgi:hypothetical protein